MPASSAAGSRAPRRRKGPDPLTRFVHVSAVLAWLATIVYLFVLAKAQPEKAIFTDRAFAHEMRHTWDQEVLAQGTIVLVVALGICLLGLAVNSQRVQRRGDRYSRSLLVIGGMSFVLLLSRLFTG